MVSKPWTYHNVMKMVVDVTARPATWHSYESEALITAVIIHEVISDHMVELNPTTVDSRTDEAEAGK